MEEPGPYAHYPHPSHLGLVHTFSLKSSGLGHLESFYCSPCLPPLETQTKTSMLHFLAPPSLDWCVILSIQFVTRFVSSRFVHRPQFWSPSRSPIVIGLPHFACLPTYSPSINQFPRPFRPCTISNRPAFLSPRLSIRSSSFE